MSNEVSMSDACDELANTIINEEFLLVHPGWSIQRFCGLIQDGETPAMSLAIVKSEISEGRLDNNQE